MQAQTINYEEVNYKFKFEIEFLVHQHNFMHNFCLISCLQLNNQRDSDVLSSKNDNLRFQSYSSYHQNKSVWLTKANQTKMKLFALQKDEKSHENSKISMRKVKLSKYHHILGTKNQAKKSQKGSSNEQNHENLLKSSNTTKNSSKNKETINFCLKENSMKYSLDKGILSDIQIMVNLLEKNKKSTM